MKIRRKTLVSKKKRFVRLRKRIFRIESYYDFFHPIENRN